MIKTVKISNFKSVQEFEIELGRLNVFIGENGCGKTSILEGIAIGGAASQERLEESYLVSHGVRYVEPQIMKSGFRSENLTNSIRVEFEDYDNNYIESEIVADKSITGGQLVLSPSSHLGRAKKLELGFEKRLNELTGMLGEIQNYSIKDEDLSKKAHELVSRIEAAIIENTGSKRKALELKEELNNPELYSFQIFAPENVPLRNFSEEGQIRPLGIRGEGLFRHLVELSKEEPETFKAIADQLSLIGWFGGLSIPNDLQFSERRISITDRFIADTIKDFDQRSANEGFLYLLFYFTLFLSNYTPKFFAIDNIDNALNPQLCAKLVEMLNVIAKEQDKQAILTTHNPAVLDGLDLTDDEQRLFVIYRNADGETKARRVMPQKEIAGTDPVRLSEAFVRGYLGGLPNNF